MAWPQARAMRVARPPVTRALLDTLEGSYLEVTLERRDQLAYLQILSERRDDTPGRITVWRTDDNITQAMRNGVLINTRGLCGVLLSSTVIVSARMASASPSIISGLVLTVVGSQAQPPIVPADVQTSVCQRVDYMATAPASSSA